MINQLKTVVLLAILSAILLAVGNIIGGFKGLTVGLIIALAMNFGSYWFSDKIVLMMYRAKKVTEKEQPELYKTVKEVSGLAGLPMPKVYIILSDAANAFATGRNPSHAAVAVTNGIMRLLTKEELKGVIAHEMAHVKNRDILIQTIAATIAAVISYIAIIARFGAIFGGFGGGRDGERSSGLLELLVIAVLAPLTATIVQLALSRSREFLADETGAKTIKNPKALASALAKLQKNTESHPLRFGNAQTSSLFIVNPFSAQGLVTLFSTHPPLQERIRRLNKM